MVGNALRLVPEPTPAPKRRIDTPNSQDAGRSDLLGNYGSRVSPPSFDDLRAIATEPDRRRQLSRLLDRQKVRRRREILRHYSRELSNDATVQFCDRKRVWSGEVWGNIDVHVLRDPDGSCRYSNVSSCGSVWGCPSCMQKITARRAQELRDLVAKHRSAGGMAYMLTLAPPHDAGDALKPLRKDVSRSWQYSIAGAPWKRMSKSIDFTGFARASELTHGINGWHPHIHALILTDRPLDDRELRKLRRFFYCRFARKISAPRVDRTGRKKRRGKWRLPSYAHGISLVESRKDDYIAKMGLADEIARGSTRKRGREFGHHRTPLEILADVAARHSLKCYDAVLWKEYTRDMKGARQLTYSRGLRARYDLRPEQTDLEIIQELDRKLGEHIASIPAGFWDREFSLWSENWTNGLEAAEIEGAAGVWRVLESLGCPPREADLPPEVHPFVSPQLELMPA